MSKSHEASGSGCNAEQLHRVTTRSMARSDPSLRPALLRPFNSQPQRPVRQTLEERKLDEKFHQQLMWRHQARKQYVASLQDLALNIVGEFVDNATYLRAPHGLLVGLPACLLTELKGYISEVKDREVQKQLITELSDDVTLVFSNKRIHNPWTHEEISVLLKLLEKCQGKLKRLSVDCRSARVHLSVTQLNTIISKQSKLQELRLRYCGLNDNTMDIIASTCKDLRVLDVSGNGEVTDIGLMALCGNCPNITFLDISCTSFSLSCAASLISQLPQSREITMTYSSLPKEEHCGRQWFGPDNAILVLARRDPTLKLQNIRSLSFSLDIQEICNNFELILSMVPNLSNLTLYDCTDITPLNNINQLNKLYLRSGWKGDISAAVLIELPNVVNKFANTLTHIEIDGEKNSNNNIDISVLAICDNLEELCVRNVNFQHTNQHIITPTSFNKLVKVNLQSSKRENCMSDVLMTKILMSPKLKEFVTSSIKLPKHLLRSVSTEASIHPDTFANLQYFSIRDILEPYSLNTMLSLICVLPNNICVGRLRDITRTEDRDKLKAFARRNGIKVQWQES